MPIISKHRPLCINMPRLSLLASTCFQRTHLSRSTSIPFLGTRAYYSLFQPLPIRRRTINRRIYFLVSHPFTRSRHFHRDIAILKAQVPFSLVETEMVFSSANITFAAIFIIHHQYGSLPLMSSILGCNLYSFLPTHHHRCFLCVSVNFPAFCISCP